MRWKSCPWSQAFLLERLKFNLLCLLNEIMKNLFEPDTANDILSRINKLQPSARQLWGKMNVSQMLAHCQAPLQVALGDKKIKQSIVGVLFGGIAKRQLLKPGEFKKNLPTDPSFLVKDERNFDEAKNKLVSLIRQFNSADPRIIASKRHPFFGRMTEEEWGILQWKHLDHHLKQFGV
jgi:hypothetical protein